MKSIRIGPITVLWSVFCATILLVPLQASAQSNNYGSSVFKSNPGVVTTIGSWEPTFTTIQVERDGRDVLLAEVYSNRVEMTLVRENGGLQIRVNDLDGDGIPEERLSVRDGKIVCLEAFMEGQFRAATIVSNKWTIDGRILIRDVAKHWIFSTNSVPAALPRFGGAGLSGEAEK